MSSNVCIYVCMYLHSNMYIKMNCSFTKKVIISIWKIIVCKSMVCAYGMMMSVNRQNMCIICEIDIIHKHIHSCTYINVLMLSSSIYYDYFRMREITQTFFLSMKCFSSATWAVFSFPNIRVVIILLCFLLIPCGFQCHVSKLWFFSLSYSSPHRL